MNPTKRCIACQDDKPIDQFGKRAASPGGLNPKCKPCVNKAAAEDRDGKREQLAAAERQRRKRPEVKAAAAARRAKPDQREAARQRTAQWRENNREQDRQNARNWAATHTEENRQRSADWKTANPERVVQQQADHYRRNRSRKMTDAQRYRERNVDSLREKRRAFRVANSALVRARERLGAAARRARKLEVSVVPYTLGQLAAKFAYWNHCCWVCGDPADDIDHYKPLSAGGAHALCNLRPICTDHNSAKGGKWPVPSRAEIMGFYPCD